MKLIIIYDINNMLPKTEYICIYMYMFISILLTHLCRKNMSTSQSRWKDSLSMIIEKMKANSVYTGEVGGLVFCTWDCIAYYFHFNHSSKVQTLLLCTERDLSSGYIPLANVLHYGTLYLNGEFYFYMNIY